MVTLWRLHINPDSTINSDPTELCLSEGLLGMGWQVDGRVADWDSYRNLVDEEIRNNPEFDDPEKWLRGWTTCVQNALYDSMNHGEHLCWTCDTRTRNHIYYLGQVNGEWEYFSDRLYREADIVNTRGCDWVKIGGVDSIPGGVFNSFIPNRTLQRINDDKSLNYSMMMYNELKGQQIYDISDFTNLDFFNLIHSEDCEDIVGIYLQKELGYSIIPSTCKKSTPNFEFLLKKDGKVGYAQVKQGQQDLNANDYSVNPNENWYLFTTHGDCVGGRGVHCITPDTIKEFAINHLDIMSNRVQNFINFLSKR